MPQKEKRSAASFTMMYEMPLGIVLLGTGAVRYVFLAMVLPPVGRLVPCGSMPEMPKSSLGLALSVPKATIWRESAQ